MPEIATQSAMNWAVRYRPRTIDQVVGNATAKATIKGFAKKGAWPGVILLDGPTSAGKTTMARIIGDMVNGVKPGQGNPDFHDLNIGDQRGIDDMRNLVEAIKYMPTLAKKIIVLEEAQSITKQGAQLLLRPLENPPKHVMFILCTNEPEKILGTVIGRCVRITMDYPTTEEVAGLLANVSRQEKWKNYPQLFTRIATLTGNQPRLSLSILQKVVAATEGGMELANALTDAFASTDTGQLNSNELIASILHGDTPTVARICSIPGMMGIMTFAQMGLMFLISVEAGAKPENVTYFNRELQKKLGGTPAGLGTLSAVMAAFNNVRRDIVNYGVAEGPSALEHLLGVTIRIAKLKGGK